MHAPWQTAPHQRARWLIRSLQLLKLDPSPTVAQRRLPADILQPKRCSISKASQCMRLGAIPKPDALTLSAELKAQLNYYAEVHGRRVH